jgi:hypothetical protein
MTMTGQFHEVDNTGDTRTEWDKDKPVEVEVARKLFQKLKDKGYLIYKTRRDGSKAEQLHQFDKDAERIMATPPIVGG